MTQFTQQVSTASGRISTMTGRLNTNVPASWWGTWKQIIPQEIKIGDTCTHRQSCNCVLIISSTTDQKQTEPLIYLLYFIQHCCVLGALIGSECLSHCVHAHGTKATVGKKRHVRIHGSMLNHSELRLAAFGGLNTRRITAFQNQTFSIWKRYIYIHILIYN